MVAAFEFESGQYLSPSINLALITAVFHLDGAGGAHLGAGPTADTIRRQAFEVGRYLTFGAAIDETEGMRTDLIAADAYTAPAEDTIFTFTGEETAGRNTVSARQLDQIGCIGRPPEEQLKDQTAIGVELLGFGINNHPLFDLLNTGDPYLFLN